MHKKVGTFSKKSCLKNVVEKLRKSLAIFFGCLSVICAFIAVRNYICKPKELPEIAENIAPKWDRNIEQLARKHSKLIFIQTESAKFKPSKLAKKILSQNYISVEISPDLFPADYYILNSILARNSRTQHPLKAGILSPNLHPIYLTSQYNSRVSHNAPTLDEALIIAVKHFEKNPYILKSSARDATKFDYIPQGFSNNFFFSNAFVKSKLLHESVNLFAYFNSQKPLYDSPAILSENARLSLRLSTLYKDISTRNASANAVKILCKRLADKKESRTAKLLYLRALGESPFTQTNKKLQEYYLQNVNKILPKEKIADTKLLKSYGTATREMALSVSVLSKAFVISGKTHFLNKAEDIALSLSNKIDNTDILPAKIGTHSEASSLEYVLCARAFFDLSKVSRKQNWVESTIKTISKWNENFMTDIKLWSINSKKSAFAKYTRPIITQDANTPSYIGEASQLFSEMGIDNSQTAKLLQKLTSNAMTDSFLSSRNCASLKLAMLPQYTPPIF